MVRHSFRRDPPLRIGLPVNGNFQLQTIDTPLSNLETFAQVCCPRFCRDPLSLLRFETSAGSIRLKLYCRTSLQQDIKARLQLAAFSCCLGQQSAYRA